MARETDFFVLYKILGLNADCDLDEFKRAYRRRIAVLHPDRRTSSENKAIAAERLRQLMALYATAMEFHRQHGRLPGATRVRHPHRANAIPSRQRTPLGVTRPGPGPGARAGPRPRLQLRPQPWPWQWLLLLAAAVAIWMLRPMSHPGRTTAPSADARTDRHLNQSRILPAPLLALGMDSMTVRAREGNPDNITRDERWMYGSSWIRFENGKVTDWYSSPRHPLDSAPVRRSPIHD